MKYPITLLFLLLSSFLLAQTPQGFNYQTVVRDNSGNIISNQNIGIALQIFQTAPTGTVVYQEEHITTTNDYGLLNIVVGQGNSAYDFTTIDWSSDSHFLEISIDITGGTTYTTMGTTELLSVPYALQAKNAENVFSGDYNDLTNQPTIINPTGLERINEGNGNGHRIIGRNPSFHGNIGANAVDLSYATSGTNRGAVGAGSTALGFSTTASGVNSVAMGNGSNAFGLGSTAIGTSTAVLEHSTAIGHLALAEGKHAVAIGRSTNAVRDSSLATGSFTTANGIYSTTMGFGTIAEAYACTVLGRYNVGNGWLGSWRLEDPVFEIGIGTSSTDKKNAITVLKSGYVGIGTPTPNFPLHITTRNPNPADWDANPNHYLANNGVGTNGTGWTYSIVASYGLWSGIGYAVSSDARIKNSLGRSDAQQDLNKLLDIEITDYQYIDTINKGDAVTKKVIAQQVKEIYPNAVNLATDFIPNVYEMASVTYLDKAKLELTLKTNPDVKVGDVIKVIPKEKSEKRVEVIEVSTNKIVVQLNNKLDLGDQLFVYGKEVDDFHTVDYDAISMLNVSATQAQQELIEKLTERISDLEKQNELLVKDAARVAHVENELNQIKLMLGLADKQ